MDIDSKNSLIEHSNIIINKRFLFKIYQDRYRYFQNKLKNKRKIVELGSGGGFIKRFIPTAITSDVIKAPNVDKVFFAEKMPFKKDSVDAFVMIDVFHHIKNPEQALREISRCLKKNGVVLMIEPYNSIWGRFIYQNFHHETFSPNSTWKIKGTKRMSDANGALPWIVFERDQGIFQNKFPELKIIDLRPHTPFKYLLSGGLSKYQLVPFKLYKFVTLIEKIISPLNKHLGMFITIELKKIKP